MVSPPPKKIINDVLNDCEGKISTNKARAAFDPYSSFTKNPLEQL